MINLYFAGLGFSIHPPIDGRKSDAKFLGKDLLGDFTFKAEAFELVYNVHSLHFIAFRLNRQDLFAKVKDGSDVNKCQ